MTEHVAELYRESFGGAPAKSFAERTAEERQLARERFLDLVSNGSDEDDRAVEAMFQDLQMRPVLQPPQLADAEADTA